MFSRPTKPPLCRPAFEMGLPKVFADRRLKKSRIALVVALVGAAAFWFSGTDRGAFAFSQFGISNSVAQVAKRAVNGASDALNAFIARSPGERGATDILKGKARRTAKRLAVQTTPPPSQIALGKIAGPPVAGLGEAPAAGPDFAFVPDATVILDEPVQDLTPIAFTSPGIPGPGLINILGGGSGFGSSSSSGGGTGDDRRTTEVVPVVVPPVASPVPEPSTWLFMIFGFGAIGVSIRRARAKRLALTRRAGRCAQS